MAEPLHFERLTSTEFEEYTHDLMEALGFVNVDWRKGTPTGASPADKGRDIVCEEVRTDVDRAVHLETWFVDCKHYRRRVPPTELQNLLSWAEAESPDVALFAVSGFLSNGSKDYLETYKRTRRPSFKIKVWEKPKLESLSRRKLSLVRKYELYDVPIRTVKAILKAEHEFFERVWYDRHQMLRHSVAEGREVHPDIWKGARAAARRVEKTYGKKTLSPHSDFEWGMINGKLSALRWVLGDEWDMLDT
jgi:hypothetical protein